MQEIHIILLYDRELAPVLKHIVVLKASLDTDEKLSLQQLHNPEQFFNLFRIIAETLVVFLVLTAGFEFFHNPMDFSIASIEERFRAGSLRRRPLAASSIASSVTALGSW